MKAAARILLVAALMISIGLHWAVLQSAAWMGMAVTYSMQNGSVIQGLSETFDGAHPCPLCHAVKEGTQKPDPAKDSGPSKISKDLKLDLAVVSIPVFVFETPPAAEWIMTSVCGVTRSLPPESPPPRRAFLA